MKISLAQYLEAAKRFLLWLKHPFKAQNLSLIFLESMVKIHLYHQLYLPLIHLEILQAYKKIVNPLSKIKFADKKNLNKENFKKKTIYMLQ